MRMWFGLPLLVSLLFLRARAMKVWDLPPSLETEDNLSKLRHMDRLLKEESRTRNMNASCDGFTLIPNSLTLKGKITRKVAEATGKEACKRACMDAADFNCVAFILKRPDTCYITGFEMLTDYYSTHYTRVCDHGPHCFNSKNGYSAGYADSIPIPEPFASFPEMRSYYCRMHAELKKTTVGFDLKTCGDKRCSVCSFVDLDPFIDYSFDIYVRRC